jgi:hypothetical protein
MTAAVVVVLALLSQQPASRCGAADVALERLAELRGRFKPGMTFGEVCQQIQPPAVVAEYWGSPPRERMGPWILSGRDGDRVATETILCDFDAADQLVRCSTMDPPWQVQLLTVSAYEAVAVGDEISAVVSRLCAPGSKREEGATTTFEYWVEQPLAKVHKSCPAYLSFRDGRLRKKEMVCR